MERKLEHAKPKPSILTEKLDALREVATLDDGFPLIGELLVMLNHMGSEPETTVSSLRSILNHFEEHGRITRRVTDFLLGEDNGTIGQGMRGASSKLAQCHRVVNLLQLLNERDPGHVLDVVSGHRGTLADHAPRLLFSGSFGTNGRWDGMSVFDEASRRDAATSLWILDREWIDYSDDAELVVKRALIQSGGKCSFVEFADPERFNYLVDFSGDLTLSYEAQYSGVPIAGNPEVCNAFENKSLIYAALKAEGLPIPHTLAILPPKESPEAFANLLTGDWILRPSQGEEFELDRIDAWLRTHLHRLQNVQGIAVKPNTGMGGRMTDFFEPSASLEDRCVEHVKQIYELAQGSQEGVLVQERLGILGQPEVSARAFISVNEYGEPILSELVFLVSRPGMPTNTADSAYTWDKFTETDECKIYRVPLSTPVILNFLCKEAHVALRSAFMEASERNGTLMDLPDSYSWDFLIRASDGAQDSTWVFTEVNDYRSGWRHAVERVDPSRKGLHAREWIDTAIRRAEMHAANP